MLACALMARVVFQPVKILTGSPDTDGMLVMADGYLAAVLVRLGALHEDLEGCWFLEAAMGVSSKPPGDVFDSIDQALDWINSHIRLPTTA